MSSDPVRRLSLRASPPTALIRGPRTDRMNTAVPPPHDDQVFNLLASSFENSLSDDGGGGGGRYSFGALSPREQTNNNRTSFPSTDITIPDLKQGHEDFSIGDISPIKLEYTYSDRNGHYDHEGWKSSSNHLDVAVSNPFFVIRSARKAFDACKYLLPCLRGEHLCQVNMASHGHIQHYQRPETNKNVSVDVFIASRRVQTAICAFGGYLNPLEKTSEARSIFRLRGDARQRQVYAQCLPDRYSMNGSMISWDVEEDPPICIESDGPGLSSQSVDGSHSYSNGKEAGGDSNDSTNTNHTGPNKMKYRCKLCGQLKQNHECPYRKSLHRSIGVMVYPAVNSFTADEPGTVAPPLTKMNNFVSYDSDQGSPEPVYNKASFVPPGAFCPSTVTPATLQHHYHHHPGLAYYSPQSSLSTNHSEDMVVGYSSGKKGEHKRMHSEISSGGGSASRHYKQQQRRSVFVASVTLRPEHYRAVTPSANDESSPSSFQYPVIPLTFAERKRLSDTLFHLSKEIPGMTDDCALILRDARANNEWDLAVSELLAQVVVGLYCGEGDSCLDGLQQYLLALGVSC